MPHIPSFLLDQIKEKLTGKISHGTKIEIYHELATLRIVVNLVVGHKTYTRSYNQEQLDDTSPFVFVNRVAEWINDTLKNYTDGGQAAPSPKKAATSKEIVAAIQAGVGFDKLMELMGVLETKQEKSLVEKLKMAEKYLPDHMTATQLLKQEEMLAAEQAYKKLLNDKEVKPLFKTEKGFVIDIAEPAHEPITDVRIMQAVLVILLMTPHDMLPKDDEPLVLTKELIDNVLANLNVSITRKGQEYTVQII